MIPLRFHFYSEGSQTVRMVVPPLTYRRAIDRNLTEFFRSHRHAAFRRALSELCRFYNVKLPKIEWFEYLDWGKTAGKTYEDGRIHLIHPENWKRGRVYKTERMWIQTLYHEMGHYLLWTDAERKADVFQRRMVRGLRDARSRRASAVASKRRAALRPRKRRSRAACGRRRRAVVASRARTKRRA
jgi:predicted SprT family Zn-dependent metalloprotease